MNAAVDHLVVAAASLAEGATWCEATFGVAPEPGGRHPLMGTHNRLLAIGGPAFPLAYLEIIAVDPAAPRPPRVRWFGLDDPALQQRLRRDGPRLVHWVARTDALDATRATLAAAGLEPGPIVDAARDTPAGLLRWRITVRDDGALPAGGALPTWIAWAGAHPAATLPARGVALRALGLRGVPAAAAGLVAATGAGIAAGDGAAIEAAFDVPGGTVVLVSG